MKRYIFSILISSLLGSIFPISERLYHSSYDSIQASNTFDNNQRSISNTFTSMAMSAIIPGSGQYYLGERKSAYIFIGLEALLLGSNILLENEVNIKRQNFREFANIHWDFISWIEDYNFFRNDLGSNDAAFNGYPQIWEDNHKIDFISGGNHYSSSGTEFMQFVSNLNLCEYDGLHNDECVYEINEGAIFTSHPNDGVVKDHNFYENIGKYSHFFAGWDDSTTDFYAYEKPNSGEVLAYSPNKKKYWELFEDADNVSKLVNYTLSALLANHVSSIFHALIISKPNVNVAKYSVATIFDPMSKIGIGGINIKIIW